MHSPCSRGGLRAFTLVELLVVLGVIALLLGTGVAILRPGNDSTAVRGAQAEVALLLEGARQTARLQGAEARLLLHADPADAERYLRFFAIVYDADPDPDRREWVAASEGRTLPRGIYAVPPGESGWDRTDSRLEGPERVAYRGGGSGSGDGSGGDSYWFLAFAPNGTVATVGGAPRIALAAGWPDPEGRGVVLGSREQVRGALVRRYGAVVLLDSPEAFPEAVGP